MHLSLSRLRNFFHHHLPGKADETANPLLDEHALQMLHTQAANGSSPWQDLPFEVKTLLTGERGSAYAGSGYEFADNQLYVAGDDSRFINWRMLARHGKLYRKVFHEERRPQLWLVVDRRSTMRFGSKTQLKVSLAARLAVYYLYLAQQHQLGCAGLVINEMPAWYPPEQGMTRLQTLIDAIIAPAPPLFGEHVSYDWQNMLRELRQRLSPGSIVLILSDFHDFSEAQLASYHALASQNHVVAMQVLDPIELELPEQGKLLVAPSLSADNILVDCDNHIESARFSEAMQQQKYFFESCVKTSGISYQFYLTEQPIHHS